MADFCFQCSIDLIFGPPGDLAGLCSEGQIINVICEGCGAGIWVDHEGWCVTSDCPEHGDMAPGRSEVYESAYRAWRRRSGPLGWAYRLHDRFFGSPWEPGLIHFPGHWPWYLAQLYRAIRDGEQMDGVVLGQVKFYEYSFTPAVLETFSYETLGQSSDGKEPAAAGTRLTGQDDQVPPETRVVRD